ncbi:TPA: hypothetical protein EYO12_03605 [Candidatus Saccharibacteria bacterium]|nr:hypothetical protein [Candidatus Saccharibacteria bacterium]HIO87883.1 hypothetical protein [Candidatus Saccharibacteria bacterium]
MKILKRKVRLPYEQEYFKSIISGSSAGISTTTAIIIGLTVSETKIAAITTSAIVIIFIQAFNAAASRFADLRTAQEIDGEKVLKTKFPLTVASIQFASHTFSGLIALTPIILYGTESGVLVTVAVNTFALFLLAVYKVRVLKVNALSDIAEFVLTGLLVMLVGLGAGLLLELSA